jgi:hypothetical protein
MTTTVLAASKPIDVGDSTGVSRVVLAAAVSSVAGGVMWFAGLQRVRVENLHAGGLLPELGWMAVTGFVLVLLGLFATLADQRASGRWSALQIAVLLVVITAAAASFDAVLGYRVSYRHSGVIDKVVRDGHIDEPIDAYFSWPGFFTFIGSLLGISGVDNARQIARFAPVLFNGLYLLPLSVLYRGAATKRREVTAGLIVFLLGNWVYQDYFAPQAAAYFVYLSVLVVLYHCFRSERADGIPLLERIITVGRRRAQRLGLRRPQRPDVRSAAVRSPSDRTDTLTTAQRMLMFVLALASTLALAASHQLTPLIVAVVGIALLAVGRCTSPRLVGGMVLIAAAWDVFVGAPYLSGNLSDLLQQIGNLSLLANENVTSRVAGDPAHMTVVRLRMLLSVTIGVLATIGWWTRMRRRSNDRWLAAVTIAPLMLFPVVSYGGEILVRIYYFSLPGLAFFAGVVLVALLERRSNNAIVFRAGALVLIGALGFGLLSGRFGNQAYDSFTGDEFEAVVATYDDAPSRALFLSFAGNLPWKFERYDGHPYRILSRDQAFKDGDETADVAARRILRTALDDGAYLLVGRADVAYAEQSGVLAPGTSDAVVASVLERFNTTTVFSSPNATVYRIDSAKEGS